MPRTVRDHKIDTPSARARLPARQSVYWISLSPGCAFGYRKGEKGGVWVAKLVRGAVRKETTIGPADDVFNADGRLALSYTQAQELARAWFPRADREDADEEEPNAPYTVAALSTPRSVREKFAAAEAPYVQVPSHINVRDGQITLINNDHTLLGLRASAYLMPYLPDNTGCCRCCRASVHPRRARPLEPAARQVPGSVRYDEGHQRAAAELWPRGLGRGSGADPREG